ncbi:MAG: hypothetical protein GYA23_12490 [Methanomicrobiales archaeon]|nr:hypothetical protein [Methanomicrobiales archaeon]
MQIVLRPGITLRQGSFSAVIAPELIITRALAANPELTRFLFLFVCGNYSRLATQLGRPSANFEVRRPFTADQLLTVIREAGHTIIVVEHDSSLFDTAERLLVPVGSALKEAGREALVILYAPSMDKSFAALARSADRLIEILPASAAEPSTRHQQGQPPRRNAAIPPAQRTLEVI